VGIIRTSRPAIGIGLGLVLYLVVQYADCGLLVDGRASPEERLVAVAAVLALLVLCGLAVGFVRRRRRE